MDEAKLKPCPFCGGEVVIADYGYYWSTIAKGNDPKRSCRCHLFMEEIYDRDDSVSKQRAKEHLIEKWNTRCTVPDILGKEDANDNAGKD